MSATTGVIEQMHESGKRFKLDDGQWYSAFAISQMPKDVGVGDTVGFTYSTVEKDGRTYHNIKGNVSKRAAGSAPKADAAPAASAGASRGASSGPSYSRGAFPVPALDGSRSIIRQNSLTQANACFRDWLSSDGARSDLGCTVMDYANMVIDVARVFEAYSAGDMDAKAAEEAVEKMRMAAVHTDSHR